MQCARLLKHCRGDRRSHSQRIACSLLSVAWCDIHKMRWRRLRIAMMLLMLPLADCGDVGGELARASDVPTACAVQSQPVATVALVSTSGGGSCALVLAMYSYILYQCGCLRCPRGRASNTKTKATQPTQPVSTTKSHSAKHKNTQSQSTYDRHLTTPRFRNLKREGDHGCWSD